MRTVNLEELQRDARAIIAEVMGGDIVSITQGGRAVAQLVPIKLEQSAGFLRAGQARPPRRRLSDLGNPPRRRRGVQSLSEVLEQQRVQHATSD